jgi:hypothetical protein
VVIILDVAGLRELASGLPPLTITEPAPLAETASRHEQSACCRTPLLVQSHGSRRLAG